jgi:hypothetical protein
MNFVNKKQNYRKMIQNFHIEIKIFTLWTRTKQHNVQKDVIYTELCRVLQACKLYGDNMSFVIWNENEKNKISF